MNRLTIGLAVLVILVAGFAVPTGAEEVTSVNAVGYLKVDGPSVSSDFDAGGDDYIEIGGAPPIDVRYNPDAGPWVKTINNLNPGAPVVTIVENLHVVGPTWTDWHQEIVDPFWSWLAGSSMDATTAGVLVIDNLEGIMSPDSTKLDFLFPDTPLPECSTVTIVKKLTWMGQLPNPGFVTIQQWPTVPEPSTVVMLLCAGLAGLLYLWRRHK